MSGTDSEPVEVFDRNGRPVRFVWRGRLYMVLFVRERWQTGTETNADGPAAHDCWRVEATPMRAVPPAIYELCHDLAADRWSLAAS